MAGPRAILMPPLGKVADVQWTSISMDRAGKRDRCLAKGETERSILNNYTLIFIIPAPISINSKSSYARLYRVAAQAALHKAFSSFMR